MYKAAYICDCCGAEMEKSLYTLHLTTGSRSVQDQTAWHYCADCWESIKKRLTLTKSELDDLALEKAIERFKEANKDWDNAVKWYGPLFALALAENVQQEKDKNGNLFTGCECCAENTNRDQELEELEELKRKNKQLQDDIENLRLSFLVALGKNAENDKELQIGHLIENCNRCGGL